MITDDTVSDRNESDGLTSEQRTFADGCRRHEHDDLLLVRPGTDRGTPT